jgi:hypothetical protein
VLERAQPIVVDRGGDLDEGLAVVRRELPIELVKRVERGLLRLPPVEASASEIRTALIEGRTPPPVVPEPVLEYIRAHGIYGAARPSSLMIQGRFVALAARPHPGGVHCHGGSVARVARAANEVGRRERGPRCLAQAATAADRVRGRSGDPGWTAGERVHPTDSSSRCGPTDWISRALRLWPAGGLTPPSSSAWPMTSFRAGSSAGRKLAGQALAGVALAAPMIANGMHDAAAGAYGRVHRVVVLRCGRRTERVNTFDNADGAGGVTSARWVWCSARASAQARCSVLLPFNLPRRDRPARLFLGDAGSHLLGLLILLHPAAWGVFVVLMLFDLLRVCVQRVARVNRSGSAIGGILRIASNAAD